MIDPAGRVFRFSEATERSVVDRMRDLDEIIASTRLLYPLHTWTRADFLLLFFLDDAGDSLQKLIELAQDESP